MSRAKYIRVRKNRKTFQRIAIFLWLVAGVVAYLAFVDILGAIYSGLFAISLLSMVFSIASQYFLIKEWALEKKYGDGLHHDQ
jgi:nicotinamide riboside transporter PnuC